jgi:hypothetical protein
MLVEVLTAFVLIQRQTWRLWPFIEGAFTLCGECYGMHAYIPDRVIIMVGDETGPRSRVYVVGYVGFSVCQAMSVPVFGAALLAILIQKVEAPEGDRWSLGSLPVRQFCSSCLAKWCEIDVAGSVWRLVCLRGCPPLAWSGGAFIRYGVYGSPALCRGKESIVSIATGCNWHLMVLG